MTPITEQLARQVGIAVTDELPAYAWPGGYPLIYLDEESNILCPACANEYRHQVRYGDINWEGPALYCDECSKPLESAYGED